MCYLYCYNIYFILMLIIIAIKVICINDDWFEYKVNYIIIIFQRTNVLLIFGS